MMKMSRSQSMSVHTVPGGERKDLVVDTSFTTSTADIPQTSTLRLTTKLGADEARTAFNEDQVSNELNIDIDMTPILLYSYTLVLLSALWSDHLVWPS